MGRGSGLNELLEAGVMVGPSPTKHTPKESIHRSPDPPQGQGSERDLIISLPLIKIPTLLSTPQPKHMVLKSPKIFFAHQNITGSSRVRVQAVAPTMVESLFCRITVL